MNPAAQQPKAATPIIRLSCILFLDLDCFGFCGSPQEPDWALRLVLSCCFCWGLRPLLDRRTQMRRLLLRVAAASCWFCHLTTGAGSQVLSGFGRLRRRF